MQDLLPLVLLLAAAVPANAAVDAELREALSIAARERAALPASATVEVGDLRPADRDLLDRARGVVAIELPPGESGTGLVTARAFLDVPGEAGAFTWVTVRIDARVPVVVASRDLARGAVLGADDLAIEPRPFEPGRLTDPAAAAGRVLGRALPRGAALGATWLRVPDAVRPGETVRVWVRSGPVVLATKGEALERGAAGEPVRIRLASSGRVVEARVESPGRVEVVP